MIDHFLNSRISANHDEVEGHSANGEILIKVLKLFFRISFQQSKSKKNQDENSVEGKKLS